MSLYRGVDIGTSGVKSVLLDADDRVKAEATSPLSIQRPQPLWCEPEPEAWWGAVAATLDSLAARHSET